MASATISLAEPVAGEKPLVVERPAAYDIHGDVGEILFTRPQMHERVKELGASLALAYQVGVFCQSSS